MRRLNPVLIIFSCLFICQAALANKQTLNSGRGFLAGKCYEEIASAACRTNSSCRLLIYPGTRGQLSFLIEKMPGSLTRDDVYFKARFLVTSADSNYAKVLSIKKLHPSFAIKELGQASFLAIETTCH